ncbi:MAG: T9SS type A sorting domain-containing protein, partial [Bacteroidota bacterium]
EKSFDGFNFNYCTKVDALNTAGTHDYKSLDNSWSKEVTYYRLKMIDKSGIYAYSKIITIRDINTLLQVNPNPAKDEIKLVHEKSNKKMHIKIFSAQGQLVKEVLSFVNADYTKISIASLAKGTYFLLMEDITPKPIIFIKE